MIHDANGTTKPRVDTTPSPWAIVLAGGAGVRLQALSRRLEGAPIPKQFCSFGQRRSFLQETLFRVRPCVAPARTLVIVNSAHLGLAQQQLAADPAISLVEQPMNRGTAAGILLPLVHLLRRAADPTVMVFPSDHGIADLNLFRRGLAKAVPAVERDPLRIVVGGVVADSPNSDYGWLVPEKTLEPASMPDLARIRYFVEKPSPEEAEALLEQGSLWSTFIIVAKARTLLSLFRRELPETADFFATYFAMEAARAEVWLKEHYADLPSANFSADLLAKAADIVVLAWPKELGWTDLGTPQRVAQWMSRGGGDELRRRAPAFLASRRPAESYEGS